MEILNFLLELSPVLTTFLFAVLAEERAANARAAQPPRTPKQAKMPPARPPGKPPVGTPDMARITGTARKVAKLHIPVLITGETGTGKSMLARWLHRHSPRRGHNFVKVNCPSLAPTMFES